MNRHTADGYVALWHKKLDTDDLTVMPAVIQRWGFALHLAERYRPGRIMDMGCGDGKLLQILVARGYGKDGLFGCDASLHALQMAAKRCPAATLVRCDLDNDRVQLGDGLVDLLVSTDVIEHLCDPRPMLDEAFRLLSDGGIFGISTVNRRFWRNIKYILVGGTVPPCSGDLEPFRGGHMQFYTKGDLSGLMMQAGFQKPILDRWGPSDTAPAEYAALAGLPREDLELAQSCLYLRTVKQC